MAYHGTKSAVPTGEQVGNGYLEFGQVGHSLQLHDLVWHQTLLGRPEQQTTATVWAVNLTLISSCGLRYTAN